MKRIRVIHDQSPCNPRNDWDNADVMFCKHSRYDLGDKDAEDPMREVAFIDIGGYELEDNDNDDAPAWCNFDSVLEMLEAHADEARADMEDMIAEGVPSSTDERAQAEVDSIRAAYGFEFLRELGRKGMWQTRHDERLGIALCRPLFLYDHSGITISAGSFNCRWDSGQVGWQYVTDEALAAEWNGDRDKALKYMDAVLETYDHYITGEVYGFEIEEAKPFTKKFADGSEDEEDVDWEDGDSCYGFYGDDPMENGMADHVPNELHDAMKEATDNVGEWVIV